MDSVALWFNEDEMEGRGQLRTLRDKSNVVTLSNKSCSFVQNFCLSKDAFVYVLDVIASKLSEPKKSTAILPIANLSAALKLLSQGAYQHQTGQDQHISMSQQSMSRCLIEVLCRAIEETLCARHITFQMTEAEEKEAKRHFFQKCGIPGFLYVVDGTHVQMIRPAENEHLFLNRKLKHSMNAMVICDHNMMIRAVDSRYGGACHDSHVWNLSHEKRYLKNRFEIGERGFWILGDSGYPLEPWLLTPYRTASENSTESVFNNCHAKGRAIIERVFSVLKERFRCLLAARELHYTPKKGACITNVCCALHNICLLYNVELPPIEPNLSNEESWNFHTSEESNNITTTSRRIRDEIRNSLVS